MNARGAAFASAVSIVLAGCTEMSADTSLPRGEDAYAVIPPKTTPTDHVEDYRIGPLDTLTINVFQEPDLSFKEVQVDASGSLAMPLIGDVRASGRTARELGSEISTRMARYLVNPQVSVTVSTSVSQQITVEGNVVAPGVFELNGSTSLLQALAQAKSPTRVARLDQVVIFRNINGKRAGAVFDVRKIRNGAEPDPQLQGGDVVVVGFSALKGAFRDFLTTAPLLSIFTRF